MAVHAAKEDLDKGVAWGLKPPRFLGGNDMLGAIHYTE